MRSLVTGAMVMVVLLGASPAAAAPGRLLWPVGGDPSCAEFTERPCLEASDCMGDECIDSQCVSAGDVVCSTNDSDGDCPLGTVSDPLPVEGPSVSVCVPDNPEYCTRPRACFTSATDGALVRYGRGDCDGDQIANGDESSQTAVCSSERLVGVVGLDQSCGRALPCERGRFSQACRPELECAVSVAADSVGPLCVPQETPLHCCSEELRCADAAYVCVPGADAFGLCSTQDYCPSLRGPAAVSCFVSPEAGRFVLANEGDCDMDGIRNQAESDEGSDPCDGAVVPNDAGPPLSEDAGLPMGEDAGPPMGEDAGPSALDVAFGGGGGCVCRASARSGHSRGALAFAALMALAWVTRRRLRGAGRPRTRVTSHAV